ncbi:MAG: hypothetical protein M1831_002251 [Alyxoria varia]|nr:MAG: hypothetical protein M1831_002251 [Alyxoria varia]
MYSTYRQPMYKRLREHGDRSVERKSKVKMFCLHGAEDSQQDNATDQSNTTGTQIVSLVHKSIQSSKVQESESLNGGAEMVAVVGNNSSALSITDPELGAREQDYTRPQPSRSQTHDPRIETKEANDSQASIEYARTEIAAMWREAIRLGDAEYREHGANIVDEALNRTQSTFRPFRNDAQAACVWIRNFEGESIEGHGENR